MIKISKYLLTLFISILFTNIELIGGSAGTLGKYEPRHLIDLPTAGMLPHATVALDFEFFQDGGVLLCGSASLFHRFFVGFSYGGSKIIGSEKPNWNQIPGIAIRVRFIDETFFFPAIAIGFDSQGKEIYFKEKNRYTIKSMGIYAVASKNYDLMGYLSIHGGINYSLERADQDRDLNIFGGVDKTLGPFLSFILEYNLALNDTKRESLGKKGRGYLNTSIRASLGSGFTVSMCFKDIIKNQQLNSLANRLIQIEFIQSF